MRLLLGALLRGVDPQSPNELGRLKPRDHAVHACRGQLGEGSGFCRYSKKLADSADGIMRATEDRSLGGAAPSDPGLS